MHELALASEVVAIIEQAALSDRFGRVVEVHLEVGRLSCVEPDALRFCFEAIRGGTIASGAELVMTLVPGRARCRKCGTESELDSHFDPCPGCGAFGMEITGGNSMKVTGLEVA